MILTQNMFTTTLLDRKTFKRTHHTHNTHTHSLSQYIPNTVMYVDVGENRDLLESLSFSFVS